MKLFNPNVLASQNINILKLGNLETAEAADQSIVGIIAISVMVQADVINSDVLKVWVTPTVDYFHFEFNFIFPLKGHRL